MYLSNINQVIFINICSSRLCSLPQGQCAPQIAQPICAPPPIMPPPIIPQQICAPQPQIGCGGFGGGFGGGLGGGLGGKF